ncbi:hypothetical protein L1049_020879 [Liquidambar formosana]|uniref:Uncharacterized protein n=1 Tax=Liquidambar formosana TaxID=63359 RepID=A0AAP0XA85_LIQFO
MCYLVLETAPSLKSFRTNLLIQYSIHPSLPLLSPSGCKIIQEAQIKCGAFPSLPLLRASGKLVIKKCFTNMQVSLPVMLHSTHSLIRYLCLAFKIDPTPQSNIQRQVVWTEPQQAVPN